MLQQYIRDPHMSGVFYAYCYGDRTLIEASSAGERVFTEVSGDRVVRRASVTGKHIQSGSRRQADPLILHTCLQTLRTRVGFDFDIEGFESDVGIIAVQLRPIPDDMPRLAVIPPGESDTNWHSTPLVWGTWMNGATVVDVDVAGEPAIMLKRASSLAECPNITRRLERGDHTLVVDVVDGFRLSHDPRYLPEVVQHRRGYAYISVVGAPLANLQPGETIEAFIDGDTGLIRRANTVANN